MRPRELASRAQKSNVTERAMRTVPTHREFVMLKTWPRLLFGMALIRLRVPQEAAIAHNGDGPFAPG